MPIVWGGVHPTLLPEQTAADARVDVVVRGEGELVVGALADALAAGAPLRRRRRHHARRRSAATASGRCRHASHARRGAHRPRRRSPWSCPTTCCASTATPRCRRGACTCRPAAAARTAAASATTPASTSAAGAARARSASSTRCRRCCGAFRTSRSSTRSTTTSSSTASAPRRSATSILRRGLKVAWRANCRFDYLAKYDARLPAA